MAHKIVIGAASTAFVKDLVENANGRSKDMRVYVMKIEGVGMFDLEDYFAENCGATKSCINCGPW